MSEYKNVRKINLGYFLLLIGPLLVLTSCTNSRITIESTDEKLCKNFIKDLLQGNYDNIISVMDPIVISSSQPDSLKTGLRKLTERIRTQYGLSLKSSLISKEQTYYEEYPARFMIIKIESEKKFGYYYFYINERTGKILYVSEFSFVKDKR